MTNKQNTVTLYFNWNTTTPDPRQFNQQRQLLYPVYYAKDEDGLPMSLKVAVKIPCTHEYVFNADKIITAQLSSDENAPEPILTPQGMSLAISLLEEPFEALEEEIKEEKEKLNEEWGDTDGWGEGDSQEGHPWDTKEKEATVDPPPDDTPQPVESKPADDSWEDAIETDNNLEDESSDDVPDWNAEETWETKTEKGDK